MEDNKNISFEVNLMSQDLVQYNFNYLVRRWSSIFIILLFSGCISVYSLISSIINHGILSVAKFSSFWILFILLIPVAVYWGAKKSYNNKLLKETKRYELSEEGIIMISKSTTSNMKWDDIINVMTTKNAVYLFISSNSAHILPLRCLTEGQKSTLLSYTKSKVKKQRKSGCLTITTFVLIAFLLITGVIHFITNQLR